MPSPTPDPQTPGFSTPRTPLARARFTVNVLTIVHLAVIAGAVAFASAYLGSITTASDPGSMRVPVQMGIELAIMVPLLAYLLTRDHWLIRKIVHAVFQGLVLLVPVICLFLLGVFLVPLPVAELTDPGSIVSAIAAIGVTATAYVVNRVITHDAIALITIAVFAGIVGSMIGPVPCMAFLGAMLVLDFFAVYIGKFMIVLLEHTAGLRLVPVFFLPGTVAGLLERPPQDFRGDGTGKKEYAILGLGDLGIPTLLVVSCLMFTHTLGPAAGTVLGIVAGYRVLGYLMLDGKPHAGLPPIAGGALIGCALGAVLTGVTLW